MVLLITTVGLGVTLGETEGETAVDGATLGATEAEAAVEGATLRVMEPEATVEGTTLGEMEAEAAAEGETAVAAEDDGEGLIGALEAPRGFTISALAAGRGLRTGTGEPLVDLVVRTLPAVTTVSVGAAAQPHARLTTKAASVQVR